MLADVDTDTVLELGTPIALAVVGAFVFVVRLMIQAALAQRPEGGEDDENRDRRVTDLKNRIEDLERRNSDLERDLQREREERAEDNRRHARELAKVNEQLQEVLLDFANHPQRHRRPNLNKETP